MWFCPPCQGWKSLKLLTLWFIFDKVYLDKGRAKAGAEAQYTRYYIVISCIHNLCLCIWDVIVLGLKPQHISVLNLSFINKLVVRASFTLGTHPHEYINTCIALPACNWEGTLIWLLQLVLILRWWSFDWVVLFLLGWHHALTIANTDSTCQGQHWELQFP